MAYLDKTSKYDREKGYYDFKCPNCNEPVKVEHSGIPYAGTTLVGCPYCHAELGLTTEIEVSYVPSIYRTH